MESQIANSFTKDTFVISEMLDAIGDYFAKDESHKINRVFVFSSLVSMRLNYEDQKNFILSIMERFSSKTIYIPAYTYNSRRLIPYSDSECPSPQNGSLSRIVFKEELHKGVRTLDEDYSYFVIGSENRSEIQASRESEWKSKSFGSNSHHEALYLEPAIFLTVGNGFRDGFTPAMHFEALNNVDYREYLDIPSQAMKGQFKKYYAKKVDGNLDFGKKGREKLAAEFKDSPKTSFKAYSIQGKAEIYAFTLDELTAVTSSALRRNKNFFLT